MQITKVELQEYIMSSLRELTDSRSSGAPSPRNSTQAQQNGVTTGSTGTLATNSQNTLPSNSLDIRGGGDATSNNDPPTISIPPVVDHYDEK